MADIISTPLRGVPVALFLTDSLGGCEVLKASKPKRSENAFCMYVSPPSTSFENHHISYAYARGYDQYTNDINKKLEQEALELVKDSEEVVFFGGLTDLAESEGFDREDMKLAYNQIHLIDELVKLNKKIIFIMYGGAPFEIPHHEDISAMLYMNLPGQSGGEALVSLLFGEVSPYGHLAFSWPCKYEDIPYSDEFTKHRNEYYKEGLNVGYRSDINMLFPFGYGLTYGNYHFDSLKAKVNKEYIDISFEVTNDSDIPLDAVAEIYVSKTDSNIYRPIKELKTYARIALKEKDRQIVNIKLKVADLAVYDIKTGHNVIEEGKYILYLSKDINNSDDQIEISLTGERYVKLEKTPYEISFDIKEEKQDKPYTLETPIMDFNSFFGKIVKKEMLKVGDKIIKQGKKIKDEKESKRVIKSGVFMKKAILVNCLRSLCYSSSGLLSYNQALGILDIANGKVFKGVNKLLKK